MLNEDNLPEGWDRATIADVAIYIQRGKSPQYVEKSDLPVVNQKCVRWDGLDERHLKFVHPEQWPAWSPERYLKKGDVLWNSTGTGTIGRATVFRGLNSSQPAVCDSHVTIVRPHLYLSDLLLAWIRSPAVQTRIEDMQSGSTNQVELGRKAVLETEIPVPPLAEQRRIVAKLEELLTQVNSTRERLSKIPALLKRFRQSVLTAACSGQLTTSWRHHSTSSSAKGPLTGLDDTSASRGKSSTPGCPTHLEYEVPPSWAIQTCKELCLPERALTYGVIKLGPPTLGGVPTLRSSDVRHLFIDEIDIKKISPAISAQYRRTVLKGGEILVTVRGTLGGVAVAPAHMRGFNVSREVAVIPLQPSLNPQFFAYTIAAPKSQKWLAGVEKGATYTGVNIGDLCTLPLPVPSRAEQDEIARRVDALFKLADVIEQRVANAIALADKMPQAILAKAFKGELVPTEAELALREGRGFETAAEMLARRREEIVEQAPRKTARGRGRARHQLPPTS